MSNRFERVLTELEITEDHPGCILRDFQTLLDFIGPEGLKTSGKHSLLPMGSLRDLDERMTRPQRPALERPQQRSYPYLNGLYMVLRATGLGVLEGQGTKTRLVVAPEFLAQWQRLNATERYFNLLEAWLLFGTDGMWGLREGRWNSAFVRDVVSLLGFVQAVEEEPAERRNLGFFNGVTHQSHLALLDLFGMVELQFAPPRPKENWRLASIRITELGRALTGLYTKKLMFELSGLDLSPPPQFGVLQPALQPYFPEWQNNLTPPDVEFRDGVYRFKVSLGRIWRRIAIPGRCDFEDLAYAVLDAFDFDDDHLYAFELRQPNGSKLNIEHPACDCEVAADEISIGYAPIRDGETIGMIYDFGDNWRFSLKLEGIDPPDPDQEAAKVIESEGPSPPQYGEDDDW